MKLSIHVIYDRIVSEESHLISDENVCFNLSGVRFYSSYSPILSKELLYIIKADQLSSVSSDSRLNFICLGDLDRTLINDKWSVITLPSVDDEYNIFEIVQGVFEEYNQWINDINNSIFNGDSLQTILNKSSIYLKNPVALFDNCQGLLMKTGELTINKLDSIWSYVLEKGYSFKETEDTFLQKKIKLSHKPFYYNSPDIHNAVNRLIAPIFIENSFFGTLAMTDLNTSFSKSEYANLCLVQEIIQNALKVTDEHVLNPEMPLHIYKLITGQHIDYSVVSYHLSLREQKVEDEFFLWCFSASQNNKINDDFSIKSYLYHISDLFKSGIIFCHENMILVCDYNLNNYYDSQFEKIINDFLSRTELNSSISDIFSNIFEINYAFNQCQISNQFFKENITQIIRFSEIYFDYILSIIEKSINLDVLVAPEIRKLNLSEPYTKELLLSLQAFLINGKNITSTAKVLNIHRHTAVYRLNNISKITGIHFENLDENSIYQLYLSCRILLKK